MSARAAEFAVKALLGAIGFGVLGILAAFLQFLLAAVAYFLGAPTGAVFFASSGWGWMVSLGLLVGFGYALIALRRPREDARMNDYFLQTLAAQAKKDLPPEDAEAL